MTRSQILCTLAVAAIAGAITPFLIPDGWLVYVLYACLLGLLVFGSLAGASAEQKSNGQFGIVSYFVFGTGNPKARIGDHHAVLCFFAVALYLAGFAAGAFGSVHV